MKMLLIVMNLKALRQISQIFFFFLDHMAEIQNHLAEKQSFKSFFFDGGKLITTKKFRHPEIHELFQPPAILPLPIPAAQSSFLFFLL